MLLRPTDQNIESLVKACRKGEQSAQFEIYERYHKAMYNTSLRIVKDGFEAEDIMQEAFLTAFKKLKSLKDNAMFGAWLKRITVNKSIKHYRKKAKENEIPLDDVLYKVEDEPPAEESDYTKLKAKQVLETLQKLKENYRMALTLHLIEGYDYEEIGEIMNISYANCRTTISRAKESLRKKLQPMAV
jgi:RNA polymerase sigma-70 factor (ECF subfamily)